MKSKPERLEILFEKLNSMKGGSNIVETRQIILDELNAIEDQFSTSKCRMDIVELTNEKYVSDYGSSSKLIKLIDHKLIINSTGAFIITCNTGESEFACCPNANDIEFKH